MSLPDVSLAEQSASYCRFYVNRNKVYAKHSVQGECQWPLGQNSYPQSYCKSGAQCSTLLDCSAGGNLSAYCDATNQCSNYMSGRRGTIFDARISPSYQK